MLDLDAHYYFYSTETMKFYGLGGLSLNFWKVTIPAMSYGGFTSPETTASDSNIGLNIGVGMKYDISEQLSILPEMRFTIAEGSFFRIGATAQYKF